MGVKNFYPEKKVVPYQPTSVNVAEVVGYLTSLSLPVEIKRSVYVIFCNESRSGDAGINNNYAGFQADGSRWARKFDDKIVGTCVLRDSGGSMRRFICFSTWKDSIDMTIDRMQGRGIFIGGEANKYAKMKVYDIISLARAYYKEWVRGDTKAEPSTRHINNFKSLYDDAKGYFKEEITPSVE